MSVLILETPRPILGEFNTDVEWTMSGVAQNFIGSLFTMHPS